MKHPSHFEQRVLDIVLQELRTAMKMRGQLSLIIDPYHGGGCSVFASPNTAGRSYSIEVAPTEKRRTKKRGRHG